MGKEKGSKETRLPGIVGGSTRGKEMMEQKEGDRRRDNG